MSPTQKELSQHIQIHPEIKEFTKNTLIFTLFFTLVLHLSWGYIGPYLRTSADATNDANFSQSQIEYLGSVASAISLSIGRDPSILKKSGNDQGSLPGEVSISEILSDTGKGERSFIAPHMAAIGSYLNLLRTDIASMLDQSNDRGASLDEHIDILKSYYTRTLEKIRTLDEQSRELRTIIAETAVAIESAKALMEEKYKSGQSDGLESVISDYVRAKESEARAKVYLTYIERFERGYIILQTSNKKILDTLINNRNAIIKNVVVVIPDSGSELLKKLNLITTEAEIKGTLSP